MASYRITLLRLADGSLQLDLDAPNGERLIAGHTLPRSLSKVLAEWWPTKGTTMMDGQRGPACATGEDVVAWLKRT